jgi:hypothetical protein
MLDFSIVAQMDQMPLRNILRQNTYFIDFVMLGHVRLLDYVWGISYQDYQILSIFQADSAVSALFR